jgi:5-methylcytosine-specific restriction protein A
MPERPPTHRAGSATLKVHRPACAHAPSNAYGSQWRKLRRYVLTCQPLCSDPFGHHAEDGRIEIATEVDHIIPRSAGGTDAIDNLQGLCITCHSRKTATKDGGFGRRRSIPPKANTRNRMMIDSG